MSVCFHNFSVRLLLSLHGPYEVFVELSKNILMLRAQCFGFRQNLSKDLADKGVN